MRKLRKESGLFLIRLWADEDECSDQTRTRWHGKLQHMNSTMSASFEDWATLKQLLEEMLSQGDSSYSIPDQPEMEGTMSVATYPMVFP